MCIRDSPYTLLLREELNFAERRNASYSKQVGPETITLTVEAPAEGDFSNDYLHSTIGQPKAEVMAQRVRDINPDCQVRAIRMFYLPQNADQVDLSQYDYVVDCIDTVSAKLELVTRCTALQVRIISAMGSGNKLDPTAFEVSDLSRTQGCPLARVMRKELRRRGISHLKVVWSREEPRTPLRPMEAEPPASASETRPGSTARRDTPGSISFVPAAAGLVLASAVVRELGQF